MAYEGYLLKIGSYKVPFRYIEAGSYIAGTKAQDKDDYTNANGVLRRNVLKKCSFKIEFEVPGPISHQEYEVFMGNIRKQYIGAPEKKTTNVTAWMQEWYKYVTMTCYTPDIDFKTQYANEKEIIYDKVRVAFIGYGGDL